MIAPLAIALGALFGTLVWAKSSRITGTSRVPQLPGQVPTVFDPASATPGTAPSTPITHADPQFMADLTAFLETFATPTEQKVLIDRIAALTVAQQQLGKGPATIADLCGVMQGVFDQGRMAQLVARFPQFASCPVVPHSPSAQKPGPTPVVPSVTPGTPAPPPTTPSAAAPAAVVAPGSTAIPKAVGMDLVLAAQLAPKVEADVIAKKYDYSRPQMVRFQIACGLKGDGLYGGRTAGALAFFLHRQPPKPLYAPTLVQPYAPPAGMAIPSAQQAAAPLPAHPGYNPTLAKELAPRVEADILKNKTKYDKLLLTRFQVAAGIKGDGLYGGISQGALTHFLGRLAPKALVKPLSMVAYKGPTYTGTGTPVSYPSSATAPAVPTTPVVAPAPTKTVETLAPAEAAKLLRDYLEKTGDFGSKAAPSTTVKKYQGPLGVVADGIVGPKTREASAKYGVILPMPASSPTTTKAPSVEADLLKSRPSTLLALRTTEGPKSSSAVAGVDIDMAGMTDTQRADLTKRILAWSKGISAKDELKLYALIVDLAKERGISLSLPLSYEQLSSIALDPRVACGAMTKALPKPYLTALHKIPTMASKWALWCSSQLVMPNGFPKQIWAQATDDQKKNIVLNWYPGVKVVIPAKPVPATQTPAVKAQMEPSALSAPAAAQSPAPAPAAQVVSRPVAPAGYNPVVARELARQVVTNVRAKQYNYDRALVKRFQQAAAIAADGIYGGGTVQALKFYGADRAPKALFKPFDAPPYQPPA